MNTYSRLQVLNHPPIISVRAKDTWSTLHAQTLEKARSNDAKVIILPENVPSLSEDIYTKIKQAAGRLASPPIMFGHTSTTKKHVDILNIVNTMHGKGLVSYDSKSSLGMLFGYGATKRPSDKFIVESYEKALGLLAHSNEQNQPDGAYGLAFRLGYFCLSQAISYEINNLRDTDASSRSKVVGHGYGFGRVLERFAVDEALASTVCACTGYALARAYEPAST